MLHMPNEALVLTGGKKPSPEKRNEELSTSYELGATTCCTDKALVLSCLDVSASPSGDTTKG